MYIEIMEHSHTLQSSPNSDQSLGVACTWAWGIYLYVIYIHGLVCAQDWLDVAALRLLGNQIRYSSWDKGMRDERERERK